MEMTHSNHEFRVISCDNDVASDHCFQTLSSTHDPREYGECAARHYIAYAAVAIMGFLPISLDQGDPIGPDGPLLPTLGGVTTQADPDA